jgi:chondroitin synthase
MTAPLRLLVAIPCLNEDATIAQVVADVPRLIEGVAEVHVLVVDDGSTDNTLEVINQHYGNNPRVRLTTQLNSGIGRASNTAVRMTRGYYIGQLDSDDYLEPDAVELCLKEFLAERNLACVYSTYRNVNPDGSFHSDGYNFPVYSREKLTTAMIAHHFRMFTARAWHLTKGFDEFIENAVDYDMYLKLSEVGPFKHINKISYNRVIHGQNTSIKKIDVQKKNHFTVVNNSLKRQNISTYMYMAISDDNDQCRKYRFVSTQQKASSFSRFLVALVSRMRAFQSYHT